MAQYFTPEGFKKLKEELEFLKRDEMRRIVKLISEAAAFGDLKENAAYHEARNMKSFLLGRIAQLEGAIHDAVIVEKKVGEAVQVGSQVALLFDGKNVQYQITAPSEADILKDKISYQSPLGQKLMGKKAGSAFDYEIRDKKIKVKIVKVK